MDFYFLADSQKLVNQDQAKSRQGTVYTVMAASSGYLPDKLRPCQVSFSLWISAFTKAG